MVILPAHPQSSHFGGIDAEVAVNAAIAGATSQKNISGQASDHPKAAPALRQKDRGDLRKTMPARSSQQSRPADRLVTFVAFPPVSFEILLSRKG